MVYLMLHKNGRCQPLLFRILMTFNYTISKVTLVVVINLIINRSSKLIV